MSAVTYTRNNVWRDEGTLWEDAISKGTATSRAFYNLGRYHEAERPELALLYYSRAVELNPAHANALMNRGNILDRLGYFEQAMNDYNKAADVRPEYFMTFYNRGIASMNRWRLDDGIRDFTRALDLNSAYSEAYVKRGSVFYAKGVLLLSKNDYETACTLGCTSACRSAGRQEE